MSTRHDRAAPRPAAAPAGADNVLNVIHMLSNRIGRAFHGHIEARFGVTLPEWRVLLTLAHHPGSTAADITNRWAMDKMAVSRAIRRLERDGRLRRRRNPADRRSYVLALTAAGRRLYDEVVPSANARYHDIVSCLGRAELARLRRTLDKLIRHTAGLSD